MLGKVEKDIIFKNMKLDLQPQDFATIIRSNGFVDGLQVPVQDALNTADGPNILSKVYTELSLDTIQHEKYKWFEEDELQNSSEVYSYVKDYFKKQKGIKND